MSPALAISYPAGGVSFCPDPTCNQTLIKLNPMKSPNHLLSDNSNPKRSPQLQNDWKRFTARLTLGLAAAGLAIFATPAQAADVFKADNVNNLNLPTSWDGAVVPTSADVAVWDNRVATAVPQTLLLGADASWSGLRILDPAGAVTISAGNALTLGAAGIDTSLASQGLTLAGPVTIGAPQNWNLTTSVTVSGVISGTAGNGITNIGTGTINVSGANNAFPGGITINSGVVNLTTGSSMPIIFNGGQLTIGAAIGNPMQVLSGGGTIRATANRTSSGPITGAGTLTVYVTAAGTLLTINGDISTFSGTIAHGPFSTGSLRPNVATFAGNTNVFWDMGPSGGFFRGNSQPIFRFGALQGGAASRVGFGGVTLEVGHLNLDTVFSGELQNGSLIKVGSGTLTLDIPQNVNTYAGSTTISNGVLQIGQGAGTGVIGGGPVTNYAGLVFNRAGTLTVANAIAGSGAITNVGSGKVILRGALSYTGPTVITAGTLALGTGSGVTGATTVGDSATLGAVVTAAGTTATHGNVNFGSGTSYQFDLAAFGNPTVPVASSSGNVALAGDVTVNVSGDGQFLTSGTITLFQYASRSGTGNFVQGTLPNDINGVVFDDTANKRVTLTITAGSVDQTLRWVSDVTGVWDSDNLANPIWRVIGTSQITNYYSGAAARFDDSATGTTAVDLTTYHSPALVTVSNVAKTYTFGGAGAISGPTELIKQGSGTLIITNANDYSGLTRIENGVLRIANETGAIGGGGVTNNGALIIDKTTATNAPPNTLVFSGRISGPGSLTYLGADKANSILQVDVAAIEGNPFSGGTTISNGYIRLNANPVNDANRSAAKSTGLGSGLITFLGDSILELEDYGVLNNSAQAGNFAAPLTVPAGQAGEFRTAGRSTVSSTLTGAGTFNLGVSSVRADITGNFSAFTGQINVFASPAGGGNDFRVFNAAGWPLAKVHLRDRVVLQSLLGTGAVVPVGELSADEGALIGFGNGVTWRVGSLNTSATNAANISSASVSFIKEGTGIWTLSGTNLDYTGSTTISNGVLALIANSVGDAGISNSATIRISAPGILDVSGRTDGTFWLGATTNAQTLLGNGTIRGSLNAGSTATITPGFGIGTLTVTNAVTLGGTIRLELNRAGSPNSDRIVAPTIAAGGTLTVTNIGGALQAGDTFQLFGTGVSGTFAGVNLPTTDTVNNMIYTWNNTLAANGSITVATAVLSVNPTPAPITFTTSGNTLDLQWPVDRTGWTLQTNSVGVAVANAWFPYPGSTTTNHVIVMINPAAPQVFFRLVYP